MLSSHTLFRLGKEIDIGLEPFNSRPHMDMRWFWRVAGLILAVYFFWLASERALVKPFWADEDNEIWRTCSDTYFNTVVLGGNGQNSTNPLYFMSQKALCGWVSQTTEGVLFKYRLISIVSGVATVTVTYFTFGATVGFPIGVWAVATLSQKALFQYYLSEGRPYMMWVFCFALMLLVAARYAIQEWKGWKSFSGVFYAGLALCLVTGPGMLQAAAAVTAIFVYQGLAKGWSSFAKKQIIHYSIAITVFLAIGYYYGLLAADFSPTVIKLDADPNWSSKKWTLNAGDFNHKLYLILLVGDMLISFQGIHQIVLSLLFSLGVTVPVIRLFQKKNTYFGEGFIQSLSAQVVAQLTVAIISSVLIYYYGYYFIQRVFIYFTFCKAAGVAIGAYYVSNWLRDRWGKRGEMMHSTVLVVFAALVVFQQVRVLKQHSRELAEFRAGFENTRPCPELHGTIVPLMPKDMSLDKHGLNFTVEIARELKRCGRKSNEGTTYVLPGVTEGRDFPGPRIDVVPVGTSYDQQKYFEFVQCARNVRFNP